MDHEKKDAIDNLLDGENEESITLYGADGMPILFEQEAVIEYRDRLYAILTPIEPLEGIGEEESLTFEIINKKNNRCLKAVTDKKTVDAVFVEYQRLFSEEEGD